MATAPANRPALDLTRAELGLPALKRQFPHLEVDGAGVGLGIKTSLHKRHDMLAN